MCWSCMVGSAQPLRRSTGGSNPLSSRDEPRATSMSTTTKNSSPDSWLRGILLFTARLDAYSHATCRCRGMASVFEALALRLRRFGGSSVALGLLIALIAIGLGGLAAVSVKYALLLVFIAGGGMAVVYFPPLLIHLSIVLA